MAGKGISLLIPYRADSLRRDQTWRWLKRYWRSQLPGAEMIIGSNDGIPFCKTAAVNNAFQHSHGDIIVILDADCYLPGNVITFCASRIREACRRQEKMWYIPYRRFYRLTRAASDMVLLANPGRPYQFPDPPPPEDIVQTATGYSNGHWFGALIQVMPREAFFAAGGMDERFNQGWGGEDVSFLNAVDTLYARHRTTRNMVLHLWHPHTELSHQERTWAGQAIPGSNNPLADRYTAAYGRLTRMHALTREPGAGRFGKFLSRGDE
jgi:Glycosyl transferase family 2